MDQIRWWQFWRSLGLEFWLPLPLLGLAFWGVSGLITAHIFTQSDRPIKPFEITSSQAQPVNKILFIKVKVDRESQISRVKIKQAIQVYQNQELELATADLKQIETVISQKLNLPPEKVRELLRYQIEN